MPEGPEIRLAADGVAAVLEGRPIVNIEFSFAHLKAHEAELRNRTVTAIETRGKAMLTYVDDEWAIFSHNQLYGRWYICEAGQTPDTNRQLRLGIYTTGHAALLYSASSIDVLRREDIPTHPFVGRLGPDVLSSTLRPGEIVDRLRSNAFSRKRFAGLLLNQKFLAGMGTYLTAEILHAAGLHPDQRAADCDKCELERLAKQILGICRRSYETRGITNPPALVKRLKAAGKQQRAEHRFSVYGRGGQPCYTCNGTVKRSSVGGRPLYYCPSCQRMS